MKSPIEKKVILASSSPRRRELLKYIVPQFEIAPSREIDESYPTELSVYEVPTYLSRKKLECYKDLLDKDTVIITADTVVINNGEILGKPKDEESAIEMLTSLVGHTHSVVTGVSLMTKEQTVSFSEKTDVTFSNVSSEDIRAYVSEYRPYDKAGAYGIQEWIGCVAISAINGCYYNVVGLPLHTLFVHLRTINQSGSTSK